MNTLVINYKGIDFEVEYDLIHYDNEETTGGNYVRINVYHASVLDSEINLINLLDIDIVTQLIYEGGN